MTPTDNEPGFLADAFALVLGGAKPGTMAFVRCLSGDVIRTLAATEAFDVPGWQVAAIVGQADPSSRCITADQAVEWRENKAEASLLLVDQVTAGAGMDGIYSAAREVSEGELFTAAMDLARKNLPHGYKGFANKALKKAGLGRRRNPLAPWTAFSYLCRVAQNSQAIGGALPQIGLWPLAIDGRPDGADLDKAGLLVERVLPVEGSRLSPEQRAASLKLGSDQKQLEVQLADLLREIDPLPRIDALERLECKPDLWLNRMTPGIFDEQALQEIVWIPWRGKTGRPLAWSGLSLDQDRRLELRLDPDSDHPKSRSRLEVRWKVEPETLSKGSIDYLVEVCSGPDVLADKTINHTGKNPQKAVFTEEDFEELDEQARFEAQVRIRVLGDNPREVESEDFVLCFGRIDAPAQSSTGKVFDTLSLAVANLAPDNETFKRLATKPNDHSVFSTDKKGFITCRLGGKVGRVFCPPLITNLATDWIKREGSLGRWRLRVRSDGTAVGNPDFIPVNSEEGAGRLIQASKQLANWLEGSQGPVGVLYHHEVDVLNKFVNAATDAWTQGDSELVLVNTLEVVSLSGRSHGIIVLPIHPLRVAWQQSFDLLVAYHRYHEELPANRIDSILKRITGAHYPSFLPGLKPGESFVFADTLGFHAVAMVPVDDKEPKATVALLGRLLGGDESMAPSVGKGAAHALAEELQRYIRLHPDYRRVRIHALRAGDAMPVARALGKALKKMEENQDGDTQDQDDQLCYDLDLYPGSGQSDAQTGRFLAITAERRRSGAGAVPEQDRWLLESVTRPGGASLPRLRWARRTKSKPSSAAHIAIAFDVFDSRVECSKRSGLPEAGVLEAHGLMLMPSRVFVPEPTPHWLSFIPAAPDGEKHPVTGILTKRQVNLHAKVLLATARHLGGGVDEWPVLVTEVSPEQVELLQDLHGLADWVITADRNAGIEYFDSPKDLPRVYESYIIDCVPERDDLGFMQMITSTASFDEVVGLLDKALGEMGLSASPRNCQFLLDCLKAISGRLALRLAGAGSSAQEMVALALAHRHCVDASLNDRIWPPLSEGFLIPLDDVPELFREPGESAGSAEQRADLLYVRAGRRDGLQVSVIEVKFRRYLKTARSLDLAKNMDAQINASCSRWQKLFGTKASELEQTVNRAWLARILRFYARKGYRHGLSMVAFDNVMREINRMVRKDSNLPDILDLQRVGFVFCPEYGGRQPAPIEYEGESTLWLFGPDILPEPRVDLPRREPTPDFANRIDPTPSLESKWAGSEHEISNTEQRAERTSDTLEGVEMDEISSEGSSSSSPQNQGDEVPQSEEPSVLLGYRDASAEPLRWHASIRSNPHLMILGLPGMGKTTSLINICLQLKNQGVTPIVFSYHEDIDEKLSAHLPEQPMVVRFAGLGFNPMEVVSENPLAYLDNVGMLRDIFSAIFPDLGDVQLGRLREALKQSYQESGWSSGQRGETPKFQNFLERLRSEDKPDRGLLVRLNELDDYGLFDEGGGAPTLLEETRLSLVEIHGTQNDALQRAFATFVLHNLYQNMFRRGTQDRITHAIIFDEAHRAAKLKLIPTMVKECRKYGIAFVVASQEAKDFDPSLFTAIANYLALRLNEADAKLMAKSFTVADKVSVYTDRIKQMPKYRAMYYGEGLRAPVRISLAKY